MLVRQARRVVGRAGRALVLLLLLCPATPRAAKLLDQAQLGCTPAPSDRPLATSREDVSLTPLEAAQLGWPKVDHRWTLEEVQHAVSLAALLAAKAPARLPRSGSARSGTLFEHLLDAISPHDSGGQAKDRVQRAGRWLGPFDPLNKLYMGLAFTGADLAPEAAAIVALGLRQSAQVLDDTQALLATMAETDSSKSVRVEGRQRMLNGAAMMAIGALQLLELERLRASPPDLMSVWAAIHGPVVEIWPRLDPGARGILVAKLEQVVAGQPFTWPVRGNLAAAAAELRARAGREGVTIGNIPSEANPVVVGLWRRCTVPGGGAEGEVPWPAAGVEQEEAGAAPGAPFRLGMLRAGDAFASNYNAVRMERGRQSASGLAERAKTLRRSMSERGIAKLKEIRAGPRIHYEVTSVAKDQSAIFKLFDARGVQYLVAAEYDTALEPLVRKSVRRFLDSWGPTSGTKTSAPAAD